MDNNCGHRIREIHNNNRVAIVQGSRETTGLRSQGLLYKGLGRSFSLQHIEARFVRSTFQSEVLSRWHTERHQVDSFRVVVRFLPLVFQDKRVVSVRFLRLLTMNRTMLSSVAAMLSTLTPLVIRDGISLKDSTGMRTDRGPTWDQDPLEGL